MMEKLLVICGPTATGKTGLALHLAKVFDGEVISADSRQVYKGMDIGTGKGLPVNAKLITKNSKQGGYYKVGGVKIWGYDLVEPTQEFSVAQYVRLASEIIKDVVKRKKLPILVGGTGLYIKGVIDGIPTAKVPKNKKLRASLEGKDASVLFEILAGIDPIKSASLNISDKKNPRRLIRAIEVADFYLRKNIIKNKKSSEVVIDVLFIGLIVPKKMLATLINERVEKRMKGGLEQEIKNFLNKRVSWKSQAMTALGYKQWKKYFEGKITKEQVVDNWKREETNYAKRQITWFKRDKRINWFDITRPKWRKSVERLVKKWYSSVNYGSS